MSYSFPESAYPPRPQIRGAYEAKVADGAATMARSEVVILGLARDLGGGLPHAVAAVEAVGSLFKDYRVAVYENDSTDGTNAGLGLWVGDNQRVFVRSVERGRKRWGAVRDHARTRDMADYRNTNLEDACLHAPDAEFAIVVDLDIGRYSLDGLKNTFGHYGWDAVFSNGLAEVRGRLVQYDAFAWRDAGQPAQLTARQVNPRVFKRGEPFVPVLSAFGGMGVYRMDLFRTARYSGEDCEHVRFNRHFPRAYVNPSQIVLYK